MKVGDLVMRTNDLVRESLGAGVIIKIQDSDDYDAPYYQVLWPRDDVDLYWYDGPELEIINESR